MFGLGFWEIGVILLVALLVLGPKKLPDLARTLGKGLRELRRASEDLRSAVSEPLDEVRKPLRDIRDELVDTVYNVEQEIRKEADRDEPGGEPDPAEQQRQQEVEELYAAAGREEQDRALPPLGPESEQPGAAGEQPAAASDTPAAEEQEPEEASSPRLPAPPSES